MGVVATKEGIEGELMNRGITCMFVGYSVDHANDVYWIVHFYTKKSLPEM
jgi:hypothetical protein